MATRYDHESQNMSTLIAISEHGVTDEHYPVGYRLWVDMNQSARWGTVGCACGRSNRSFWQPETETYLGLLIESWKSLECSVAGLGIEVIVVPAMVGPKIEREQGLLRLIAPSGVSPQTMREFLGRSVTRAEHNRIRDYLGLPHVEQVDVIEPSMINRDRVSLL